MYDLCSLKAKRMEAVALAKAVVTAEEDVQITRVRAPAQGSSNPPPWS